MFLSRKKYYPNTSQRIIKTVIHFTIHVKKKKKGQQSKTALTLTYKILKSVNYDLRY